MNQKMTGQSGWVRAVRGLTAVAMTAGLLAFGTVPHATAAPGRARPVDAACGTWVLEQVSSATQLKREAAAIDDALATPGVTGFSMRISWQLLEDDPGILDKGLALARARAKEFSIRFMAGRYTPARVFAAGAYSYVTRDGVRMPQPFSPAGKAGNPVFERAFAAAVERLAAWSRANGVKVLHLPWYGFLWAEIYNDTEVERQPGYSWGAWLAGHEKLAQIGLDSAGADLAVEFALSGHWGSRRTGAGEVASMLVGIAGENSPKLIVQGNGRGRYNASATSRPIAHAKQMYNGTDYDWASVYKTLQQNNEEYLEVYTSSFSQPSKAQLATHAQMFAERNCGRSKGERSGEVRRPRLGIADVTLKERTRRRTVRIPVELSEAAATRGSVGYVMRKDTARRKDFVRESGTVKFRAGATRVLIPVVIKGGRATERREWFTIRLVNPVGATIADGRARVTIRDND